MQPLLNATKAWQTIPAGSLKKWEPSRKHTKNKLILVTEADKSKNSSRVNQRRWNKKNSKI